jgi:hypothetical protein
MENRIDRKDDERLYQPPIHSDRIRTLYGLKQATGKPMTVLLDQAIRDLAANYGIIYQFEEEPVLEKVEQETWEEISEYIKFLDQLEIQKCSDELEEIRRSAWPQVHNNTIENDNRR